MPSFVWLEVSPSFVRAGQNPGYRYYRLMRAQGEKSFVLDCFRLWHKLDNGYRPEHDFLCLLDDITRWQRPLSSVEGEALLDVLRYSRLPILTERDYQTRDGVEFVLRFHSEGGSGKLSWLNEAPIGWESLESFAQALMTLAGNPDE